MPSAAHLRSSKSKACACKSNLNVQCASDYRIRLPTNVVQSRDEPRLLLVFLFLLTSLASDVHSGIPSARRLLLSIFKVSPVSDHLALVREITLPFWVTALS